MSQKRNDIIEEQRKSREEFLRLKKMQRGEIEPESKPSEVAVVPKTFGQKLANIWYHFKVQIILAVCLIIILIVTLTQCATAKKYDCQILYFAYRPIVDSQAVKMEEYFEKYVSDVNGDGEVNVQIISCGVTDDKKDASKNSILQRVQSVVAAEPATVLYVVDEKAIEYFENAFDESIFYEKPQKLGKDFYAATKVSDLSLPEGLMLGIRRIKGTEFENEEEAKAAFKQGQEVIEKLKKQNG